MPKSTVALLALMLACVSDASELRKATPEECPNGGTALVEGSKTHVVCDDPSGVVELRSCTVDLDYAFSNAYFWFLGDGTSVGLCRASGAFSEPTLEIVSETGVFEGDVCTVTVVGSIASDAPGMIASVTWDLGVGTVTVENSDDVLLERVETACSSDL